ncbi:zinc finger protein 462-like [Leptonychotes weddellii]|uniref:Zinc finger protein 462-like n=1 Tax=Leptonychotes weddellii TaxID=9713 RepID=A0A7F8Q9A3_LEPWE|nr:zinc finger protein 462-like [Leptonychotes weddellii]
MEVLQCDGCDFRAPSYEDLKAHIQDVHTAFLQPTDVAEDNANEPRSGSMNASNQTEVEYSSIKDEFVIAEDLSGQNATALGTGSYYGHSPGYYGQHIAPNPKPTNKFFQCKFCVRYFRSKNLLIEHTRKVHGAQAEGSSAGPPVPGSLNYNIMMHEGFGKVFSCQFCTYKSPRRARIIKHQKMYHKNNLKETTAPLPAPAPIPDPVVPPVSLQDPCKELPAEVVERSILESMVKPLTKSRGNFCCEWCSYQTPRRERWCDHMMKKHRSMVKILSSLRQQQEGTNLPDVQNKNAPSPTSNSTYLSMNAASRELPSANVSNFRGSISNSIMRPNSSSASKFPPVSYPQMKPKSPHNSGLVNLAERSRYGMADMTNSSADLETNSMLNDSSSDEELNELDSENGLNAMDHQTSGLSAEQLMGSDGNKLLETKGIPFRRFMNRFQCPFCPFLTMHRRSISRHIENIHLSGKTAVYKCDECPFTCKSSLKLGAHKQCHTGTASDWDAVNSQSESLASPLTEGVVSYEGSSINGRKSGVLLDPLQQGMEFYAEVCELVKKTNEDVWNRGGFLDHEASETFPSLELTMPILFSTPPYTLPSFSCSAPYRHLFPGEHAYKCSWCSFSTMTISQLKEHSLKVHGKALTLPRPRIVSLLSSHAHHSSQKTTPAEEVEDSNDSSYSEPPDVQQQLNHYQSAALARNNSRVSPVPLSGAAGGAEQKTEAVLHCEFCEFSSGYIQSIRRHYRDKHGGKKLFKCKDCSFYTGFKSAFTMHVEAGHSAVPEEGPKDLRCPLCLYHTKYKRNMIDHIVLHREERVVPIEVCRSKLSKYLQGVVFRCDKCTFTCSSDESLQQHIEKHNELKPYKCQLCYYEAKHTEELDSHLRDEHKVSRNFELVGRVNLDQLEQMKEKMESSSSEDEDKEEEMNSKADDRDLMRFSDRGTAINTEKRFPCEFCGRAFSQGSEWERHVLRHGMALNDTKQVSREEIHLKESVEDSIKMPSIEEKEDDEAIGIDFSLKNETVAICVVAADKSLLENAEAKNE